jgi:hypothetical protein
MRNILVEFADLFHRAIGTDPNNAAHVAELKKQNDELQAKTSLNLSTEGHDSLSPVEKEKLNGALSAAIASTPPVAEAVTAAHEQVMDEAPVPNVIPSPFSPIGVPPAHFPAAPRTMVSGYPCGSVADEEFNTGVRLFDEGLGLEEPTSDERKAGYEAAKAAPLAV